jgi:hypothetical protein
MKRWIKRFWSVFKVVLVILLCVTLIPVAIGLAGVVIECRPFSSGAAATSTAQAVPARSLQLQAELPGYLRPEDQSYLTLPEWYIVYSADEYAAFIAKNPPSQFPYFRAIGQYWENYYTMCGITRDRYAFNGQYHVTLTVIGASFTIENMLKGIYENTIGRLSELLSSRALSAEDAYARQVAAEYGTFLHTVPWYQFPFGSKLGGLWRETPLFGPNILRKAERKGALTAEYGSKALYGWLIKQATQSTFTAQDLEIYVWAEDIPPQLTQREPQVTIVRPIGDQGAILKLPRYEAFTQILPRLARQGVRFVEIAGNDEILVTAIAPQSWEYKLGNSQLLSAMPILTQPDRKRVAIRVLVGSLHEVIRELDRQSIPIEHVYDY